MVILVVFVAGICRHYGSFAADSAISHIVAILFCFDRLQAIGLACKFEKKKKERN